MKEIKLYNSILKPVKRLLLFTALFAVCFYVCYYYVVSWPVWAACIILGLGAVLNLYYLLDRRPKIILSNAGIYDGAAHNDIIGWQVIKEAYAVSVYGQLFICLAVDDKFKPINNMGDIYKRLALFTKSLGAKELNLSLTRTDVDAEKMAAFIVEMKAATDMERERLLGTTTF